MIPDGSYVAVVDRIESGLAVLQLTDGDDRYELVRDRIELPEDARHEDAVLRVRLECGTLVSATYDAAETEKRRERTQRRFDRLSQRPPDDDGE